MTDIAQIAGGLTYKESAAVRGIFAWDNPIEQDRGEQTLYALGLWNPKPPYGKSALTPLGLQVKEYLEKNDG